MTNAIAVSFKYVGNHFETLNICKQITSNENYEETYIFSFLRGWGGAIQLLKKCKLYSVVIH